MSGGGIIIIVVLCDVLGCSIGYETGSSWSVRPSKPVKNEGEVVDLGSKFRIAVDSDSDSSDAEFTPENVEVGSGDSGGDTSGGEGGDEGEEEEEEEGGRGRGGGGGGGGREGGRGRGGGGGGGGREGGRGRGIR